MAHAPLSDTIPLQVHTDIPYMEAGVPHPLQKFDLYVPEMSNDGPKPLICFVHGGAWRSEDKADHEILARRLATLTGFPVAVPNYRLNTPSAPILHPTHAHDLRLFLEFVVSWNGPDRLHTRPYDASRLYLIGHSCSAHMLTSIFLAPPPRSEADYQSLAPSSALVAATRAIVMSEGIYDIELLLKSFPPYKDWFIEEAFGDRDSYAPFNTASFHLREDAAHIGWFILHSDKDTLVDRPQSESVYARLGALYAQASADREQAVQKNWHELQEEHNDMLRGETYPRIIADYIARDVQL